MADRLASTDVGYLPGDLSLYPLAVDTKSQLYEAKNNAATVLVQSLTYAGRVVHAADASAFPTDGLIRVGREIIYYGSRTSTAFKDLIRPFAGAERGTWPPGTAVLGSVMGEHHNSIVDAILNLQRTLGIRDNPTADSLNGILIRQEQRFLAPKPLFRAVPKSGPPPHKVRFQNFSGGAAIRFLWDFGDGATSTEDNPTHTYLVEGSYTVKLNMITDLGATGVATKNGYVRVAANAGLPFFYVTPESGTVATEFSFVDQTHGEIASRHWIWGDGTNTKVEDPDVHAATHTYDTAGTYRPKLLVVFTSGQVQPIDLPDTIEVTE